MTDPAVTVPILVSDARWEKSEQTLVKEHVASR